DEWRSGHTGLQPLSSHVGNKSKIDGEETEDILQHSPRFILIILIKIDAHSLLRKELEVSLDLIVVQTEFEERIEDTKGACSRAQAVVDLLAEGLVNRSHAQRMQVLGEGPLRRVPEDHDDPGLRDLGKYSFGCGFRPK